MANQIFRDRLINNIEHAIREAANASEVSHPGMVGRIRELVASQLLKPLLPAGFELGTGKIVDTQGKQSAETDVVIYNRTILPPIMYSERDGVFPIESTYYAIEVKSCLTAAHVRDAMKKGQTIITSLTYSGKQQGELQHRTLSVLGLFAFASDLSDSSSELDRYASLDPGWQRDPVLKTICVVGRGYWYHNVPHDGWLQSPSTSENDEVIDWISGIVNTLASHPAASRRALLGHYLMIPRPATVIRDPRNARPSPS